jgi:hypothetical protein
MPRSRSSSRISAHCNFWKRFQEILHYVPGYQRQIATGTLVPALSGCLAAVAICVGFFSPPAFSQLKTGIINEAH